MSLLKKSTVCNDRSRPKIIGKSAPRKRTSKPEKLSIQDVPVFALLPCPENIKLYNPNDPHVEELAKSIKKDGILDPLAITLDDYILSGHCRLAAAKLINLDSVPCRRIPVRYADCTREEILHLLREFNRQRIKGHDELIREEAVSVDPAVAYEWLLEFRRRKSDMSGIDLAHVKISWKKRRNGFSASKRAMLDTVVSAVQSRRKYWPLSDRQIHYILCGKPPLRNTRRRKSKYINDRASYKDLCDMLLRARLVGIIPWSAISDETRSTTQWNCFSNVQDFIRKELGELFGDYMRDLQRSQPNHVEILCEKLTLKGILEPVAAKYCIPLTIGRGYCSSTPRYEMAQRFLKSGKSTLTVLVLSDFDPDGEGIAESFASSMACDFGVSSIQPIKAALTADQVSDLNLIPEMKAKKSSIQYTKFSSQFGDDVYELEAVAPEMLQELLTKAIETVFDMDLWTKEVEAEAADAAALATQKQRAVKALGDM